MAVVSWLSSLSGPQLEPFMWDLLNWDKLCHAIAFAAGAVILAESLQRTLFLRPGQLAWIVILTISLLGAADEWHQLHTPQRGGADVLDWLADTVGATVAAIIYARSRFRVGKGAPQSRSAAA